MDALLTSKTVVLISLVVLTIALSVFVMAFPIYPEITGAFDTTYGPRFVILNATFEKITVLNAWGTQRGNIFLIQTSYYAKDFFDLTIAVFHCTQRLAENSWQHIPLGRIQFWMVLDPSFGQQGVPYHIMAIVKYQDGAAVVVEVDVPSQASGH